MNTVNIYVDEQINQESMRDIYRELMTNPHVLNVELKEAKPHDIFVEYEEHHNMPMQLLGVLQQHGLHADIVGC